ncbi:hypothetical protein N665_0091s0032 [Sinapis alba]|nr:hypothetical protein N665_0091s0032 [Sinapis alba]
MGEPKISSELDVVEEDGKLIEIKYFSKNKTYVFWNMDDYPIPAGVAPLDVIRNIKSVLHQLGFPWWLIETRAYGDDHSYDLCRAGIYEGEISDAIILPIELITLAAYYHREPSNFVVIAKITPESQLRRVLDSLKSRNNVVAFIELPDSEALNSIESLANSIHVIGGIRRPICRVSGLLVDVDAFRWTLAYRPFFPNKEDGCSCDWSLY